MTLIIIVSGASGRVLHKTDNLPGEDRVFASCLSSRIIADVWTVRKDGRRRNKVCRVLGCPRGFSSFIDLSPQSQNVLCSACELLKKTRYR